MEPRSRSTSDKSVQGKGETHHQSNLRNKPVSRAELEGIAAAYKRMAVVDKETLNARASLSVG